MGRPFFCGCYLVFDCLTKIYVKMYPFLTIFPSGWNWKAYTRKPVFFIEDHL